MTHLKFRFAGLLGAGLVRALFTSTRIERLGAENYQKFRKLGRPVLFVFWHGGLLPLVYYHRREGIVVLTSEHRDGEYITQVIKHCGFRAVRGSLTRGGTKGLRGLVRAAQSGHDIAITPDGPSGPGGVLKLGSLMAAQIAGLPIVPISVIASSAWHLGSWDRFLIPKVFSTIRLQYHSPRFVERNATRKDLALMAMKIEEELNTPESALGPQFLGTVPEMPHGERGGLVKY